MAEYGDLDHFWPWVRNYKLPLSFHHEPKIVACLAKKENVYGKFNFASAGGESLARPTVPLLAPPPDY